MGLYSGVDSLRGGLILRVGVGSYLGEGGLILRGGFRLRVDFLLKGGFTFRSGGFGGGTECNVSVGYSTSSISTPP